MCAPSSSVRSAISSRARSARDVVAAPSRYPPNAAVAGTRIPPERVAATAANTALVPIPRARASRSVSSRYVRARCRNRVVVSCPGALAYKLPTSAPTLVPMTQEIGKRASRIAASAPSSATPRVPPADNTRHVRRAVGSNRTGRCAHPVPIPAARPSNIKSAAVVGGAGIPSGLGVARVQSPDCAGCIARISRGSSWSAARRLGRSIWLGRI